jgi:CubicO group peptidase (beta-lactamase class C family)
MGTADLPHSTPSAEGVAAAGIDAFLDLIDSSPRLELHSLIVLRHGRIIAEGWWSPYSADRVHLLYSLSKSFTVTAVGLAVAEGLVDLDAPVLSYFPELADDVTDPRSRAIKVRDIAAMASGHLTDTLGDALRNDPEHLVRGFLLIPPDREPGSVFAYNQPCTYSLAAIVQRRSRQTLVEYLRPRLFDPLGIGEVAWMQQPPGRDLGYSGLYATTDAVARLGQLYLRRGRWGARQLLAPSWVDQASRKQVDNPNEPNPDWRQGYGFHFWRSRHGYRGDGAFGQFCVVLPEHDMVIAMTAAIEGMQALLDAVWTHVLPALDPPERNSEADRRLADRLTAASLPAVAAEADPVGPDLTSGATFVAGSSSVQDVSTPAGRESPVITRADVRASAQGWDLSLSDAGGRLDVPVRAGVWTVGEHNGVPVAASGGWVDASTFVAEVVFLETPHRARVTCSAPGRALTVEWATTPMQGRSVLELRKP